MHDMIKNSLFKLLFVIQISFCFAQTTSITQFNTLIKPNHNFGLTNPLWDQNCLMTYDFGQVDTNGAAFSLNFVNPSGIGFKGYPSGTVGGFKSNGTYNQGIVAACGLPVTIQNLNQNLRMKWKVSQQNANDTNDKWWASINVIFDSTLPQFEPIAENRDYDLVIELNRYQQEAFLDVSSTMNQVYWYYARNTDGSLKTLDFNYNGTVYSWVVRYKFFNYPLGHPDYDKNDKVHVKFSPLFNNNVAPFLDHSLKKFIDTSVDYLQYVTLTLAEENLANQKVGDPNLWIKSISAGYEVYTGSFTIANDYFYTLIDNIPPSIPLNLTASLVTTDQVNLDWNDTTENDLNAYKIYKSINGGAYSLFAENVYVSNYLDTTTAIGNTYSYYVVTEDRSFNVSMPSNYVTITLGSLGLENNYKKAFFLAYPNPVNAFIQLENYNAEALQIELYNVVGSKIFTTSLQSNLSIDLSTYESGIYFLKAISENNEVYMTKILKK